MNKYILFDSDIYPSDAIIFEHIGEYKTLWNCFFKEIADDYPTLNGNWKYYNDVKSWLYKMTNKSKTIFWLSLYENSFRVTYYFNSKNEDFVYNSSLPQEIKDSFKTMNSGKKFKNFTITVKSRDDLGIIMNLLSIKLLCK